MKEMYTFQSRAYQFNIKIDHIIYILSVNTNTTTSNTPPEGLTRPQIFRKNDAIGISFSYDLKPWVYDICKEIEKKIMLIGSFLRKLHRF